MPVDIMLIYHALKNITQPYLTGISLLWTTILFKMQNNHSYLRQGLRHPRKDVGVEAQTPILLYLGMAWLE
jgi:hypothetical protein